MDYRVQKIAARIISVIGIALVAFLNGHRAIRDWQLGARVAPLAWAYTPVLLVYIFFRFKTPEARRSPDPYWAAVGDDYTKLIIVGGAMIASMMIGKD